ncbi:MAG: porin [Verrucomicrobia bacterium]|nr:porin [Verrucomicrobiota bacterium]
MNKLPFGSHLRRNLILFITVLSLALNRTVSGKPVEGAIGSSSPAAVQSDSERLRRLEKTVDLLLIQNTELRKQVDELRSGKPPALTEPANLAAASHAAQTAPVAEPHAASAPAAIPGSNTDVKFFWKNGLGFESADGKTLKGKIGGRIQFDMAAFDQDASLKGIAGDAASASEFRRVRIYTSGDLNLGVPVFYKTQIDFAGSDFKFADVYVGLKEIPYLGVLQLGQRYEPFSLEQLTSDNYTTFMERAAPIEAFSPARNVGAMVHNEMFDGRATWALGIFSDDKNDRGDGDSFDSGTHVTGRITALPWKDESSNGRRYWHVGAGGSVVDPENDTVRFRARPEAHLAPPYVDTKDFGATALYLSNVESLWTFGSVSLQAEYFRAWVNAVSGLDPGFDGFYVFGSWFLTGEHRPYVASEGIVGRVQPLRNFSFRGGGFGALEFALRYSRLNLDDESVTGGRLADYTAGLNWHLNPNARAMLNYIFSDVDRGNSDGRGHSIQTRFQVDF